MRIAAEDFTYEYDDLDRLSKRKITGGADQETFEYNQIGNLTTKNSLSYTYGSTLHVHAVASFNGVSYGYDNNGNMASAGNWAYAYDKENRMVKATLSGAVQARFAYDGDGKRGKRVDANGTIHYVGGHHERSVGNGLDTIEKITKYYYASLGSMSKLIALRKNGVLYYLHSDHLGSSTRITDASGNILDSTAYTVYGETRSGGTNLQTDRKFTGQILDLSTGLYWYSSRPHNPVLCRFIQPDTIVPDYKNPQALNRYSYAINNPLKYVDPTGHWYDDEGNWHDDDLPENTPAQEPTEETVAELFGLKLELGPVAVVDLGNTDNDLSRSLTSYAEFLDAVDLTMTATSALVTDLLGIAAGPVGFAVGEAIYAGGVSRMTNLIDLAGLGLTTASDVVAGRTGGRVSGNSATLYVGTDTIASGITAGLGVIVPEANISILIDLAQSL